MRSDGRLGVCMVSVAFYPDVGGIQMNVYSLSQHLVELGVDVTVITRRMSADVPRYEELDGIKVFRLDIPRSMSKPEALARFVWGARQIMAKHSDEFQVVHSHELVTPTTIGLIAKETLGKKLVATPHTSSTSASFHSLVYKRPLTGKPRLKWMQKRANAFVAISREIEADLLQLGFPAEKIHYIPNGIDTRRFAPVSAEEKAVLRDQLGLPKGPLIAFVGRLIQRKQVDVLLRAFNQLKLNRSATAGLLVLGDGPERDSLQELAEGLGISDDVHFLGSRLNTEVYLQASDVFVLPSSSEGMPIALLEAMSTGIACIASSIGGVVDLIEDGVHGVLSESGDVVGLSAKIAELLSSPDRRLLLGRNARNLIHERFSMTDTAKTYLALYKNVLQPSEKVKVI